MSTPAISGKLDEIVTIFSGVATNMSEEWPWYFERPRGAMRTFPRGRFANILKHIFETTTMNEGKQWQAQWALYEKKSQDVHSRHHE